VLVCSLAVLAAALFAGDHALFAAHGPTTAGGFALLMAAFCAADLCVVHLDLGKNAHSFALAEIPIAIGLFCVAPWQLGAARVGGGAIPGIWRYRRAPIKLAFNASLAATEAAVYLTVFHAVSTAGTGRVWQWLGALVACQCMNVIGAGAVSTAIGLTGGEPDPFGHVVKLGAVSNSATLSLGLLVVEVARRDTAAMWMVGVVAAVLYVAYRQIGFLQRRYTSLRQVQEFTRVLAGAPELSSTIGVALEQAMSALQGQRAELCLFGLHGTWNNIRIVSEGSGLRTEHVDDLTEQDPLVVLLRREPRPLLIAGGAPHAADVAGVRVSRGAKDLVASPLVSGEAIVGTFAVFDHLGDVSTFTEDDLRVFETLANHVTLSLEKARLTDKLRDEVAEKEHAALHDPVTGLGNRELFIKAAGTALRDNRVTGRRLAVMVMDINQFKVINDTLGHHTGDTLLRQIGERMRALLPPDAAAARLGGDEFVFTLSAVERPEVATQVADRLLAALSKPFSISGLDLAVGAAIGIAIAPDHGEEPGVLLQHADIAMSASKEAGVGTSAMFSPDLFDMTSWRLSLGGELRTALETGQLELHYQPVADFRTGAVVGMEALLRWNHPVHGWVAPEDVVALAERLGLIRPLTMWALEAAIDQCRDWRERGRDMHVAVNLAAQSLVDETLAHDIDRLLTAAGVDASSLILEITETQVIRDPQQTLHVLEQLHRLGLTIAVDDFGTGYSSLSYLSRLPIGEIKIDKSFVQQMLSDPTADKIVRSIVDLGRSLGKTVVAEGVEDLMAWDALAQLGCDLAQGYYLSRPLPAAGLENWLTLRARPIDLADATGLDARRS
jgi:diguanylate cyclase (GGDEF)-like protein